MGKDSRHSLGGNIRKILAALRLKIAEERSRHSSRMNLLVGQVERWQKECPHEHKNLHVDPGGSYYECLDCGRTF